MVSAEVSRYTIDGCEPAEYRIASDQSLIGTAVRQAVGPGQLVALVLAGGYGRGEGGYRFVDGQYLPYNDYDYFAIVRGGRSELKAINATLQQLAHELGERVGVEVDIALLRYTRLARLEYTLMYSELQHGHRVVIGEGNALGRMRPMPFEHLPLAEFARLLLNRGSLLLMNRQMLERGGPHSEADRETFERYLNKALLACADARLAAAGCYHPSYSVKRDRLVQMRWSGRPDFLRRYDRALRSRTGQPVESLPSGGERAALATVVSDWLAALAELETRRLGRLPAWAEYSSAGIAKGQSARGCLGTIRNLAVNLRDFGPIESLRNTKWALRYPRERLISALPALLEPTLAVPTGNVATALAQPADTPPAALIRSFLECWSRYN